MTFALTDDQMTQLVALRHDLHRTPEVSGQEEKTAARIVQELNRVGADQIWTGLGGHGVAAAFNGPYGGQDGGQDGPTVLFRCELDGLPIQEISDAPYRSGTPGKGHLCGHDGHMVMVLGLAMALAKRPKHGRVIVLFQPAEETGAGAAAIIADPRWPEIKPDFAFAYHNVPGQPLGQIDLCKGVSNCASRGMKITFGGKTSHAAAPEDGKSPGQAMAHLMRALPALGPGGGMQNDFALATLTHANLGAPSFGIAPGAGELRMTLRSQTDSRMAQMVTDAEAMVAASVDQDDALSADISWHEVFLATVNTDHAVDVAKAAADKLGLAHQAQETPMRWSEDFGRFGLDGAKSAMLFIGSGEDQPQLHNPNFDFPDALIPFGVSLFAEIANQILSYPTKTGAMPHG